MPAEAARDHKRDRIYTLLVTRLGIKARNASSLINRGIFDNLSLEEALAALNLLIEVFGDYVAWVVLEARPTIVQLPVHRLKEHFLTLVGDGFSASSAQSILAIQIDLVSTTEEQFRETLTALRELLPNENARHFFLRKKPAALRLTAQHIRTKTNHLRWNDDADAFWNGLRNEPDPEIYEAENWARPARTLRPMAVPLAERFVEMGLERTQAEFAAIRFFNSYREQALRTLELFLQQGWSGTDIYRLTQNANNAEWRRYPNRLLAAERELCDVGFASDVARNLVIGSEKFTAWQTRGSIPQAVATFRSLGYDDERLLTIARTSPKAMFSAPEKIRAWHAEALECGRDPLNYLAALTKYKPATAGRRRKERRVDNPPVFPPARSVEPTEPSPELLTEPVSAPPVMDSIEPPPETPAHEETVPSSDERRLIHAIFPPPPSKEDLEVAPPETFLPENDEDLELVDSHLTDWKQSLAGLLKTQDDVKTARQWRTFEATNHWMWDRTGPTPAALSLLAHWFNISHFNDRRSKEMDCLRKIVTRKEFHPILKLSEQTLQHRLAALRVIIQRDFIREPEWLLCPWETLPPAELRYRVHEVEGRRKRANLKPYIRMLLEPTREKFLARLNTFIKQLR